MTGVVGNGVPTQQMSTRGRVIDEIISTERTFVANLKIVFDLYIEPLRSRGILTTEEISSLFRYDPYSLHTA